MDARIMKAHVVSGKFDDYIFDDKIEHVKILFEDKEYQEYCGIFGGGDGNKSKVIFNNNIAFVISYGQGYIFSIDSRTIIHKTINDRLENVIFLNQNNFFLAHSQTNLLLYDSEKLLWKSKRISADGIRVMRVDKNLVYGEVFDFHDWVNFSFDISKLKYKCEWYCEVD